MSIEFNFNDAAFKRSVSSYGKALPEETKIGMEKVGFRAVKDIVTLPPKSPKLDSFLDGAFTVSVTGRDTLFPGMNGAAYPVGGETGINTKRTLDPDLVSPVDTSGMEKYELRIGNSMKYAARLHENPFNPGEWSERKGGVGYKFISIKLYGYGEKYLTLLASFIKDAMSGRMFS